MWGMIIVFAGFLFEWLAIILKWNRIKPFSKVLAMVILILWTLFIFDYQFTPLVIVLLSAQIFGLIGDIFLLFSIRWFVWGMGAFLLGHIGYFALIVRTLINSYQIGEFVSIPLWVWFFVGSAILALLFLFYRVVVTFLLRQDPEKSFILALFIYAFCLSSVMVLSYLSAVLLSGGRWVIWALPLGGTLFFASDFTLAYDRFVKRLPNGQLWVMVTYLLGQFFLAVGLISLILKG